MAERNIKINVKATSSSYDTLFPQTKSSIVSFDNSGSSLVSTNVESTLKELDKNKAEKTETTELKTKISTLENKKANKTEVLALNDIKTKIFQTQYDIGDIFLSFNSTNPSIKFGGTWELTSKGTTLFGVDPDQIEFNTVKKTGGEKTHTLTVSELPSHNHAWSGVNDGAKVNAKFGNQPFRIYQDKDVNWPGTTDSMKNTGGNAPHNNLPPYMTCYIWTRIA